MGKILIIKGADFSAVAVNQVDIKTYIFNISDSQFLQGTIKYWNNKSKGYCIVDQSKMQGKTLRGMKMNVSTAGTVNLYKASKNNPKTLEELTYVATATAQDIGIQEIVFSSPISLGTDEYLVIGKPSGDDGTLSGIYSSKREVIPIEQAFNYYCGKSTVCNDGLVPSNTQSLNIDFYY